ncbi:MAG: DUF2339 domain-containing protein [Pseudobdellovibrio sp.]
MDNSENKNIDNRLNSLESKIDELSKKYLHLIDFVVNQNKTTGSSSSVVNSDFSVESRADKNFDRHVNQTENTNDKPVNPGLEKPSSNSEQASSNNLKSSGVSDSTFSFLPIISMVCFVFAGIFLVKMTIDSGWLNLHRQWGLASLFGVVLLALGRFLDVIDRNYRSYLSASGVVVLYVASITSHTYFHVFPQSVAMILAAISAMICIYLADHHKSEIFLLLTAAGVNFIPLLVGYDWDVVFYSTYYMMSAVLFSGLAFSFKSRVLSLVASYLSVGVYALLNKNLNNEAELFIIIVSLCAQFVIISSSVTVYSIRHKSPLNEQQSYAYLPLAIFFYAVIYRYLNLYTPDYVNFIALAFSGVLLALHQFAKKYLTDLQSHIIVYPFAAVVILHAGYFNLLPIQFKTWLLPLFLFMAYVYNEKTSTQKKRYSILYYVSLIFAIYEFLRANFNLMTDPNSYDYVPLMVCVFMLLFYYYKNKLQNKTSGLMPVLIFAHIQSIIALYRAVDKFNTLAVTSVWSVYAIVVLAWGYIVKDRDLAKSSMIIFAITAAKALLFDLASSATGVRVVSLMVTGFVLYLAGYVFKKVDSWK